MAGQVCEKCGQVIKAGDKIIFEEGKPVHHPYCPAIEKEKQMQFWLDKTLQRLDAALKDESEAINFYLILMIDLAYWFPPGTPAYDKIKAIREDENRHFKELQEVREIILKKKQE